MMSSDTVKALDWALNDVRDLFVIEMPRDYHCLFHSISYSLLRSYRRSTNIERNKFVKKLRKELAEHFTKDVYENLYDGNLIELSKQHSDYSYENMLDNLRSDALIGYGYLSYICDQLNFDIYILDNNRKKPYVNDEFQYIQKGRKSVIILYSNNDHYDLVSLRDDDGQFMLYFPPNHPIIRYIQQRNGSC